MTESRLPKTDFLIDLRQVTSKIEVGTPEYKVLNILQKLPVMDERKEDIEKSARLIGWGSVLIAASDSRGPRSKNSGKKKAIKSLLRLHQNLAKAAKDIHNLTREADEELQVQIKLADDRRKQNEENGKYAVHDRVFNSIDFQKHLAVMAMLAEFAADKLEKRTDIPNPGRPKKSGALQLTKCCFDVYEKLTGKKPTILTDPMAVGNKASGPFLDFLRSIFVSLEINASPEACARSVSKEKRSSKKLT